MDCQLDIFFLEAILNGLLLAGLLALLALGLNLIFGVIDVVWICYAELMMSQSASLRLQRGTRAFSQPDRYCLIRLSRRIMISW